MCRAGAGGGGQRAPGALHLAGPGALNSAPSEQARGALCSGEEVGAQEWNKHSVVGPQGVGAQPQCCREGSPLTLPRFFPDPPNSISPRHRPGPEPGAAALGPPGQVPPASCMRTSLRAQSRPLRAGEANPAPSLLGPAAAMLTETGATNRCPCPRALPSS